MLLCKVSDIYINGFGLYSSNLNVVNTKYCTWWLNSEVIAPSVSVIAVDFCGVFKVFFNFYLSNV